MVLLAIVVTGFLNRCVPSEGINTVQEINIICTIKKVIKCVQVSPTHISTNQLSPMRENLANSPSSPLPKSE